MLCFLLTLFLLTPSLAQTSTPGSPGSGSGTGSGVPTNPCAAILCEVGHECDPATASCVAVTCDASDACPSGKTCVPATITCIRNPCPQFTCEPSVQCPRCRRGEECDSSTGRCVAVTCARATCPTGSYCRAKTVQCVRSPCPQYECVCRNSEYEVLECGNICPQTCASLDTPTACPAICGPPACGCPPGKITSRSRCLSPSACPCTTDQCGPPLGMASARCADGSLGGPTGRCVRNNSTNRCEWEVRTCPCTGGKEYQSCGSTCPPSCATLNDPPMACPAVCVEGCFCPEGKVDDGSGNCVDPSTCPAVCPSGETFNSCGTDCPLTCANYDSPPQVCNRRCRRGCFCNPGTVRDTTSGRCVNPRSCPRSGSGNSGKSGSGSGSGNSGRGGSGYGASFLVQSLFRTPDVEVPLD